MLPYKRLTKSVACFAERHPPPALGARMLLPVANRVVRLRWRPERHNNDSSPPPVLAVGAFSSREKSRLVAEKPYAASDTSVSGGAGHNGFAVGCVSSFDFGDARWPDRGSGPKVMQPPAGAVGDRLNDAVAVPGESPHGSVTASNQNRSMSRTMSKNLCKSAGLVIKQLAHSS